MFTGIVASQGLVKNVETIKGGAFLKIAFPERWKVKPGDSMAVDGICLTVRKSSKFIFSAECMPETMDKTTAKYWSAGRSVNLERPLAVGARLGGGFVEGHIDEVGRVVFARKRGLSKILAIKVSRQSSRYIVPKGGITVNGVNLTVTDKRAGYFSVSLVSYTLTHTNLGQVKKGDLVNIETDILAKYVNEKKPRFGK